MSKERSDQWGTDSASAFITGFGSKKIVSTGVLLISKALFPTRPSRIDACVCVCTAAL